MKKFKSQTKKIIPSKIIKYLVINLRSKLVQWLMSVILATWEVEIGWNFKASLGKKFEIPSEPVSG
jgi:hypothetical protein